MGGGARRSWVGGGLLPLWLLLRGNDVAPSKFAVPGARVQERVAEVLKPRGGGSSRHMVGQCGLQATDTVTNEATAPVSLERAP